MTHGPAFDFIALQSALAGEYSIDREIGRGGMGVVYLAREVSLARPVAIKVLSPEQATREVREAFIREAQIAARLSHPNIVPVHAVGERAGYAYIVMAYVEGITLGERIRARGPMLPGQTARLLREVAWALAYAHAGGIVHRDISAENIVLERGTDRAIVMDFGIASASRTAAVNEDGRVMGNPYFLSPEQATGEPVDSRSDLYSLGVCGFYALTARLPFSGETPTDVVAAHISRPAPPIGALNPAVPARLAQAIDKCLAKEPWRRYRSAEAFAEAIDQAFEHAREIPAPLRVWIRKGETETPARLIIIGVSVVFGALLSARSLSTGVFFIPVGATSLASLLPGIQRLRRVVGNGYSSEDLAAALREHQLLRDEEIAYERAQSSPWKRRLMWVTLGASVAGGIVSGQALASLGALDAASVQLADWYGLGILSSLGIGTMAVVGIAGEEIRQKLSSRAASWWISFWKGRAGKLWTRVTTFGVRKPAQPVLGMPMLTEIALGRATDHLFQALPKAIRHQLDALPDVVRRLEREAASTRQKMDEIDIHLGAFDVSSASETSQGFREAMREELRENRADAAARLAATVAALENIRLDLLRLQMGHADVASVTASLEAAQRIGEEIAIAVRARDEVDELLRVPLENLLVENNEDDDADTPVGGVSAARL